MSAALFQVHVPGARHQERLLLAKPHFVRQLWTMVQGVHSLLLVAWLGSCLALPAAEARVGEILFSSNRSGGWRIWRVNADGSNLKLLGKPESEDQDVDPMLSPDGKAILFTSTRGGKAGVWRMLVDGSQSERICDGDQAEWSPDGGKIAFRRGERIVVRDLSNSKEITLTPEDWPHCSGPAWSPDGKTIAFAARWEAGNGVYTVATTGGKPVKVYDQQGACEPHWSPDGTRIVYETETHICAINPDGTKNRTLTYFGGVQRYARYSPDGKTLVFCQGVTEQGPWELYLIPAVGGTPQKLTEGGSDMYPDWR
jgi:Tol biopolymer transport system component